ncbi:MAG: DNA repair protein RadC [Lachnospiraceae bacterium]|nr:DNA repair protein RadC [Lachnospiraceae bacterium]
MKKNAIKNNILTPDEYPYEKFEKMGPEALTDAELLAIVIRTGTIGENSLSLAKKVLALSNDSNNGILALQKIPYEEMMKIKGIGKVKAIRIKCMVEFTRRMSRQSALHDLNLNSPETVADYYMEQVRHLETEHVYLILADNKNRLIKDVLLSKGTVNASLISTREIFIEALRYHAVRIFLIHNHPSGDPTPSRQDIEITKVIREASEILNIPLLDHIIIGDNTYVSLKEKGYL